MTRFASPRPPAAHDRRDVAATTGRPRVILAGAILVAVWAGAQIITTPDFSVGSATGWIVVYTIAAAGVVLVAGRAIRARTDLTLNLRAADERYGMMVEQVPAVLYEADFGAEATWHYVSPRIHALLGFSADEWTQDPGLWMRQIHPDDRRRVMESEEVDRRRELGAESVIEYRALTRDGREVWIRDSSAVIASPPGEPERYRGFLVDISAQKAAEIALRESEKRTRLIIDNGPAYVAIDARGTLIDWNEQAEETFGWSRDEVLGQHMADRIIPAKQRSAHGHGLARYLETGHGRIVGKRTEVTALHRDGHEFPADLTIWQVGSGETVQFSALIHDITARKQLEVQLQHQAFHDSLTGLANRALFRDRVEHAISRRARHHGAVSVLFSDLDDFKTVNDSLGHDAGDQLLMAVAERLRAVVRPEDTTARIGGDEFAILLEETDEEGARQAAMRVLEALRSPFEFHGRQVVIHASIGAAITSDTDILPEVLLQHADLAMNAAKSSGKGQFTFYEPQMHLAAVTRLELKADLEHGIANSQFDLHYQPIVDLRTGQVAGLEALLRWHHPERGVVLPGDFIPIADETGLIVPLGGWVVEAACRQLTAWDAAGEWLGTARRAMRIWINLSSRQLQEPGFVDGMAVTLASTGVDGERLTLEITESVLMADLDQCAAVLHQLRALGLRLAIDDFGTGYSSLSYLERLPIEVLKMDRSFTAGIQEGRLSPPLVRSIVGLGQTLDLQVLAEGIESPEQLARLRTIGCHLGQGFLFSPALPADEVVELLRRWSPALVA